MIQGLISYPVALLPAWGDKPLCDILLLSANNVFSAFALPFRFVRFDKRLGEEGPWLNKSAQIPFRCSMARRQ